MRYRVDQIAEAIGGTALGAVELVVTGVAEPRAAGPEDLALALSPSYAEGLAEGRARVAIVWPGADWHALGLHAAIEAPRGRLAMAHLTAMADPGQGFGEGVHPSAVVDPTAELADDVSVGPLAVIQAGAQIGAGAVIGPQCYVGADARLGAGAFLREGVSLGARVRIGARFVAQPGARVGADGFSFVTETRSAAEEARASLGAQVAAPGQPYRRIHSLGAVSIGDDVELGAGTAIDSGTIRATQIGDRTKIDNLVHIGHNVQIGHDCLICAQVGIAGSSRIGNFVVLAGQTGINDNIFVGDNVITGGASKLFTNVPAGRVVLGSPATKMETQVEIYKTLRRLPRLFKQIAALQKAVSKLGQSD